MRMRENKSPNLKSINLKSRMRGQVLAWTIVLLPLLLVLVGLVFDGGLLWVQFRKARWAADGAAVAAASAMDWSLFRETGEVQLTEDALYTALYYAEQNYAGMRVSMIHVQNNVIYVEGRFRVEPAFLGMFGVSGFDVNVRGKERPAWGISEEGE